MPCLARPPSEAAQQFVGSDFERAGDLDEGVDPRKAKAPLGLADLGSVKRGPDRKLILREISGPAETSEVVAEASRYVDHGSSRLSK